MFQSGFKESESEKLDLPGKKLEDVKEFLQCIYPNCLVQVSYENALRLLPLFDEYQVHHLKTRCENVLVENVNHDTPVEELYQRLNEADLYNLKNLREKCITFAVEKTHEVLIEAKHVCKPPPENLVEILEKVTVKMAERYKLLKLENEELSRGIGELRGDAGLGKQLKESYASDVNLPECYVVSMTYISTEIKKSKELVFEDNVKWKDAHVVLIAPVAKQYCASIEKEIWGVPIQISTSTHSKHEYDSRSWGCNYDWFRIKIKHLGDDHITCKINARCDLVNRQPNGEHISVRSGLEFGENCQEENIDVKKINYLKTLSAGLIRDGTIGVIVHLYMSEPNKR